MMSQRAMLCIVLLTLSIVFTDVSVDAQLTVKPSNTAALVGSKVVLQCATSETDTSSSISWTYGVALIVYGCVVQPDYGSQYSVNNETGHCDLVINEATLDMAGKYRCLRSPGQANVQLTVIESCPNGSQSATAAAVDDIITTSCWLNYRGSIAPQLQWTPGGQTSDHKNSSTVMTSLSTVVQPGMTTVPSHSCSVSFPRVPVYPTCDSWQSSPISVTYCAQNVSISGVSNGSTVDAGSVLSCSAEGYPPPTYQWTAVTGDVEVTGSSVTVQTADMYYVLTCTASNTITHADGTTEECYNSSTVYFNTSDVPPTTTATTTTTLPGSSVITATSPTGTSSLSTTTASRQTSSTPPDDKDDDLPLIVGLSVGIGALVILIFIILLCVCCPDCPCYYRACCKRKKGQQNEDDVDSGGRTVHLPMSNPAYQQDNNGQPDLLPDNKPGDYSYPGQPYNDKGSSVGGGEGGVEYAELQVPREPRSRTPVVEPSNTVYGNVVRA